MVNTKKLLALAGVLVFLVGAAATAWALNTTYNRPNPLMDYVPQENGVHDGEYQDHDEDSCRECHGNSLADRHHLTETVVRDRLCTPCHDIIPNPPGVLVYRNCVDDQGSYGCHNWASILVNGWHHDTDFSHSENCTACHNPNLVAQIDPARAFEQYQQYPNSLVTPTPWSCENCHWDQAIVDPDGDPNTDTPSPGHPSSYDHYNIWGQGPDYFEYGKAIKLGFYTHHFGTVGNVWPQCGKCHGIDPNDQSYDPYNPELIRYCMLCHDIGTLHTIQPHVVGVNGWEAVGFHDPEDPGIDTPTTYRSFTANEMCIGCHADSIPEDTPDVGLCTGGVPAITLMDPTSGACTTIVTLRGSIFGAEKFEDSYVQMKGPKAGNPWNTLTWDWTPPIYSWTENQIEFEIPCEGVEAPPAGLYRVRVVNACGASNNVVFALNEWGTLLSISPQSGPCDTWITLTGSGFGSSSDVPPDGVTGLGGIHRGVDFVSSQGTYTAKQVQWTSDTQIRARFFNMFEDGEDPVLEMRNFVQDDGSDPDGCPNEPTITKCQDIAIGTFEVYFWTVYYTDTDLSGGLTCGDDIQQVTISDPELFELVALPTIFRLNPDSIDRGNRLKILGWKFGPYQNLGEVRIGGKLAARQNGLNRPGKNDLPLVLDLGKELTKVRSWSSTIVKVKCSVPTKWKGKSKYVWIEKDGMKSNWKKLNINP